MMSAMKCEIIADSKPFFQYSHPKITPPMPFKITARAITKGVMIMKTAVDGMCNKPNMMAAIMIASHVVNIVGFPSLVFLILGK